MTDKEKWIFTHPPTVEEYLQLYEELKQLRTENDDLKRWNSQQKELIIDMRQRLDKIKKALEDK